MKHSFPILDPNLSFYPSEVHYYRYENYYESYHAHGSGSIEINCILDGGCEYILGDRHVVLNKRSMLIHNANVPHVYKVSSHCLNLSIICKQENLSESIGTISILQSVFPNFLDFLNSISEGYYIKNSPSLRASALEIHQASNVPHNTYYLNLLLNKLFIGVISSDQSPASLYVEQAKDYIRDNYFSIKNIDEIAKKICLNKVYLQRIFHEKTGASLWHYLTDIRMDKAAYFLATTKIPIGEIDELIGVNSRQNFYLLFKNKFDISPSEYRKRHKSNIGKKNMP